LSPLLLAVATAAAKAVPTAAAGLPAVTIPTPVGSARPAAPITLPAPTPAPVQTAIAQHAPWLTHGLAGIFIISAVALVFLLAIQTTKQEGLTGSIGGRVESAYRGRLGAEEQLKRATGFAAVVFVVTAFILSLTGI